MNLQIVFEVYSEKVHIFAPDLVFGTHFKVSAD